MDTSAYHQLQGQGKAKMPSYKTLVRLFGVGGNCLNCNFELGEVSYVIEPLGDAWEFASQNGALCAECALQLLTEGDQFTVEEEALVHLITA